MVTIRELAVINGMVVCLDATENGIVITTTTKCYKLMTNKLVPIATKPDANTIIALERANKDKRLQDNSFSLSKKIERYRIEVEK